MKTVTYDEAKWKLVPFNLPQEMVDEAYAEGTLTVWQIKEHWAKMLNVSPQPADTPGLPTAQEPKYTVNGSALVNRASGEAIPPDEPVFIFRARDVHAREALEHYTCFLKPGDHRDAVVQRIADFAAFSYAHPARMKEPDTAAPQPAATSADALLREVGRAMVNMTTTVRGEEEWMAIPALWQRCMEERDQLKQKLAATSEDARDAARYRWLRDNSATYSSIKAPIQLIVQEHAMVHKTHGAAGYRNGLDAAIDAAMKEAQK